eukprot:2503616-Amphidinium_carterae.1
MAVWVAVSANTLQVNLQGLQLAPMLPERSNVTVSDNATSQPCCEPDSWMGTKNSGLSRGLAGRPRWRKCQLLWQQPNLPWQNQ